MKSNFSELKLRQLDAALDCWRSADQWPPRAAEIPYYLLADGSLATEPSRQPSSRAYRFDPRDPVPTLGGRNLNLPSGPWDQRPVESRADVLLFDGPPLA